jgi:uncharacterized coiled-coil protein SlyX
MKKLLRRWADAAMTKTCDRLQARVAELESRLRIQQLELDELAAVITRNLKRVDAETAIAARRIADAEGQHNVTY